MRLQLDVGTRAQEFERESSSLYASRNEGVKAGRILVLEERKKRRVITCRTTLRIIKSVMR